MAEIAPFSGILSKEPLSADPPRPAPDLVPAIYRCHQSFEHQGRAFLRKSFIARFKLSPLADGVVRTHEPAQPERTAEELKRIRAARAHLSPLFARYSDRQHRTDDLFESLECTAPEIEAQTADGVVHRIWRLTDETVQARLASILSPEPVYLADCRPLYEAMLEEGSQWGLACFCNEYDPGLLVGATHRSLGGLPGFSRQQVLQRAREFFTFTEGPLSNPDAVRAALAGQAKRGPTFAMVTPGLPTVAYLRLRRDLIKASVPALAESRALGELDLTHLHALIFEEILGVQERQVRYFKAWDLAFAALSAPDTQALFLTNPTSPELLRMLADENRVLPAGWSWFHPGVPSGIVVHPI